MAQAERPTQVEAGHMPTLMRSSELTKRRELAPPAKTGVGLSMSPMQKSVQQPGVYPIQRSSSTDSGRGPPRASEIRAANASRTGIVTGNSGHSGHTGSSGHAAPRDKTLQPLPGIPSPESRRAQAAAAGNAGRPGASPQKRSTSPMNRTSPTRPGATALKHF